MNTLQNDLFIRACKRLPVDRTPVWIMRQAGRYLPEYRAVRDKVDFLTLCKTPELAAEVSVQPVDIIGVDACIIFSDILVIPEAMGMNLSMEEGIGPLFDRTIRSESDFQALKRADVVDKLQYVMDAVSLTKKELNNRVPLIGFCGSPWTLLTYMVEGKGSKNFKNVKTLIYENPGLAHKILDELSLIAAAYLSAKIESGADAVQIFDSWGGALSHEAYNEFSLAYIKKIIKNVKRDGEPIIVFSKGVHQNLGKIAESGADVMGLDWTFDIGEAKTRYGGNIALQGNMDPCILYADNDVIKKEVQRILRSFGGGTGHVFNLGHGILPDIDPEKAKAFVRYVKEESLKYHKESV